MPARTLADRRAMALARAKRQAFRWAQLAQAYAHNGRPETAYAERKAQEARDTLKALLREQGDE